MKGFIDNVFDGHTIKPLLTQMLDNGIALPQELAYDRGMAQNYLGGKAGVQINALMAATAWNLKKMMEKLKKKYKKKIMDTIYKIFCPRHLYQIAI